MVKILLDPSMYHPHLSVAEECFKAADLGYEYIELSPRADFHEWHHYPKVDDAEVAKVKKAMSASGVKIWTFNLNSIFYLILFLTIFFLIPLFFHKNN